MDLVPGSLTGAWTIGRAWCSWPCLLYSGTGSRVLAAGQRRGGGRNQHRRDLLAHQRGWWRYPGVDDRGFGPLVGTSGPDRRIGLSLIAWRAHRPSGLTGTIVFLLALAAYGSTRDWTVSHVMRDLIVFGGGAALDRRLCRLVGVRVRRNRRAGPPSRGPPGGDVPRHGEPVESRGATA